MRPSFPPVVLKRVAFGTVLLLGFVLRLYGLVRNGFGNEYYSAGVFSMTHDLHNFLFNAFDPAGALAVDKPPVALWVQAISARLFGFAPLSVLVPQAIEGMVSVVLVGHLVRRRFSAGPGLLAALVLAITPISVAVDRSSNVDSCLVMVLLFAAWALLVAAERASWRLLLVAMALAGVGFNVKMLAAFVVLPAFALTYWLGTRRSSVSWPAEASRQRIAMHDAAEPQVTGRCSAMTETISPDRVCGDTRWRRLMHLAAGGVVCLVVSLAWVGAVELTPATERPFVDSSPVNSMLDLVVDHNGMQRFFPRAGAAEPLVVANERVPAGPLRLADPRLASQVGWLLPLALIGGVSALAELPLAAPGGLSLVLWFGWLLTYGVIYSAAGGLFSPYYLVTLAPPLAVLAAVGFVSLWTRWREGRRWWGLLPVALMLTAGWQVWLIVPTTDMAGTIDAVTAAESGRTWLALGVMGSVVTAVLGLGLAPRPRDAKGAAALGLLALLAAPALWSVETAFAHIQGARPLAALDTVTKGLERRGFERHPNVGLADFLRENAGGARFVAATANARLAASLIIATRAPVLAMGGFIGNIPVVTLPELEALVGSGQVRFVLLEEADRPPGAGRRQRGARPTAVQQAIFAWVHERGILVDPDRWHRGAETVADEARPAVVRLYDLGEMNGPR